MRAPTDDDPKQLWRDADDVPSGTRANEHDPTTPTEHSTTQKKTGSSDREDKPSSDQRQTSRQASLAPTDISAQVDLVSPLAGPLRKSSSQSAAGSLLPPLEGQPNANGTFQTSAHEPQPAPPFPVAPAVTAPPERLEMSSPCAEPYQTASLPVGATVASATSSTTTSSNVEASSSSFAGAAAEFLGAALPQPGSPPLWTNAISSPEDLPVPSACAKLEATTEPTSPMVDPKAASNAEFLNLSSPRRSRLLHDDVPPAMVLAREKVDAGDDIHIGY
ncbi:hypothetical protein LTR82_017830 [Friedmanniomyces endolithicus]|uniref:Uncharacterized protein n=1 Tax=Friedmanniomyces endolithicus TaxID=329885 RepID=A0AAN6F524_9PEZI|nr:hypothetical protein LTR82_017830 [Friedmanniomyces endolithicus]